MPDTINPEPTQPLEPEPVSPSTPAPEPEPRIRPGEPDYHRGDVPVYELPMGTV